jgi:hypothetical protein
MQTKNYIYDLFRVLVAWQRVGLIIRIKDNIYFNSIIKILLPLAVQTIVDRGRISSFLILYIRVVGKSRWISSSQGPCIHTGQQEQDKVT